MRAPSPNIKDILTWNVLALLVLLLPIGVSAGTASVTANCRSLIVNDDLTGYLPGVGIIYTSITTYDGSTGRPLGLNLNGTFDNSEELRPRIGSPGVYEADYVSYHLGVAAWGYFIITLPTTDSDGNGLPDVTQKNKASNISFTGSGASHYSRDATPGSFTIQNGTLTRAANAVSGNISFTSVQGMERIDYSGTFSLSTASGTVSYTRGSPNSITFNLTLNDGTTTRTATGSTSFTVVNANQITLPQFLLTGSGFSLTVQPMTLNRTGQNYAGDMTLADGDPATPWADYTRWVIEIVDPNDTDGDSIPDLSDAVMPLPSLAEALDAPSLSWTTGGNAGWQSQLTVTHDGVDAARSGTITHSQESWLQTTVLGPGTLTYWWKVSSEIGYDFLEFHLDGVLQTGRISGEVDWQRRTNSIPAGSRTVRWRYVKDNNTSSGQDCAWLDEVHFAVATNTPPSVWLSTPLNGATFPAPATITLNAEAFDTDGSVANVEFFNGATRLGQAANAPYSYVWTTSTPGTHLLTARATDNLGASRISAPVRIVVDNDPTRRVIYSTTFEAAEGYDSNFTLAGQNGWRRSGNGSNGVLSGDYLGHGACAYIGHVAADSRLLFLWRPILYTPEPALPLVKFSVLMTIVNSTNGNHDGFLWELYNAQGQQLFSLCFDIFDRRIYYKLDGDAFYVDTQKTYNHASVHHLLISLDIQSNRWNATLDGISLVSQLPITTSNSVVDIGSFDAVWAIYDINAPGNNFMVFDNYEITAEARSAMPPRIGVLTRPTHGQITLRVQGTPGVSFTLQSSTNLSDWTNRQTKSADGVGIVDFIEPVASNPPRGYFRAQQSP
jgi:hypothetical protein